MNIRQQKRDIHVYQSTLSFMSRDTEMPQIYIPFFAQIIDVYSDRCACDVKTMDGQTFYNVSVLVRECGLVDGKPYGEIDMPQPDDWVVVSHIGAGHRQMAIIGTIVPYLANDFTGDPVNSSNKQFTTSLLEKDKPKTKRRIFPSGTSVEVQDDGTIIIETPDGTYLQIDSGVLIHDKDDNIITMDSSGTKIEDKNGNDITMASGKVTINGNLEIAQ